MNAEKPHYKVIKNSLVNIIKHDADRTIIQQAVVAGHRIVTHTLQFIKLYLLSCTQIVKIDHHFVMCCMRVVRAGQIDGRTKNQDEHRKLSDFFDNHYKSTISVDDVEKMMNVFPCRTDIVPKYITFDTVSLICLLLKDTDRRGETQVHFKQHVRQEQIFLWSLYFKTDAHCFGGANKLYQFN